MQAAGRDFRDSSSNTRAALEELCERYWPPVYAFLRRKGNSRAEAEDLTQGFFVHLLDHEVIAAADPDRGRFRSFLLKSVSNFVQTTRRYEGTIKRGGDVEIFSFDFDRSEDQYRQNPADSLTPEQIFERRWALTLLDTTLEQLRNEYTERNHQLLFESLQAHINQDRERIPYAQLGERLNMTEDAIKQAARRLKLRYREILRAEIANTLGSDSEIEDELAELMRSLGSG